MPKRGNASLGSFLNRKWPPSPGSNSDHPAPGDLQARFVTAFSPLPKRWIVEHSSSGGDDS